MAYLIIQKFGYSAGICGLLQIEVDNTLSHIFHMRRSHCITCSIILIMRYTHTQHGVIRVTDSCCV